MIYVTAAFFALLLIVLIIGGITYAFCRNECCAWCAEERGIHQPLEDSISHTICDSHKTKLLAEFADSEGFEVPINHK